MNALEFIAELSGSSVLNVPADVVSKLPKTGRVRVLLLTDDNSDDWNAAAYAQFLREDPAEDAIYDGLK